MTSRQWHGGELRWDREAGEWAIIAPGRADRSHDGDTCPFCPGPTEDTPPESFRLPGMNGMPWRVRAVLNRHPLSDRHEVLIESPRHDWDFATAQDAEVLDVLSAWQQRHRALRPKAAQVVIFRNRGRAAGVSLPHPHSQLVGLPVLSASTRRHLDAQRHYHHEHGRRLAEDLLAAELSCGERIVFTGEYAVAFVPFAPATEFEVRITPGTPRADFTSVPRDELADVAVVLRVVLAALRGAHDDPAYNLIVHTAPTGWELTPFLSWSVRILPRLTVPAGLERATGIPVLTTTPEQAAARLRALI